jgi:hypothetical protein
MTRPAIQEKWTSKVRYDRPDWTIDILPVSLHTFLNPSKKDEVMDINRSEAIEYIKLALAGALGFSLMFATAYLIFPDGNYASDFDVTVDGEVAEREIDFDDRSITLGYNSSGPDYVLINGSKQTFELEGRQNEIFAVDGKVYMFYFESAGEYLRLLRIEEL